MTLRLLLLAASVTFLAGTHLRADDTKEFLDPSNWEGLPQYWKIEDGMIIGNAPEDPKFNTFYCTKKEYGDFEMTFKIRLEDGKGNSGIQVRSEIFDREKFRVRGPQVDAATGYYGALYGEGVGGMMQATPKDKVNVAKLKDFNDYYIKVEGDRIVIKINGETTVDKDFPQMPNKQPMPKKGIIAIQIHAGGPMKVEMKDITFKELK